ncbi:MAG TPA: DUF4954 family protein [Candidatus Latescibacteria bacterium]|jgi:hypothetical protein|nr:DUF4954 family protein [Candidatus Latescibacterota bacterium]HJP33224.1 DUF4954 family protein [Candidatus Latescibacterota bacterium]
MSQHHPLSPAQIQILEGNGCRAEDWSLVIVADGFDPARVHRVHFVGQVRLGSLSGHVEVEGGLKLPAGLADATIVDCDLGDDLLVERVGGHLANYDIDAGVVITDVGTVVTRPGATFGHGVCAEAVNEGGGREVTLFAELSSQFAYLQAMHRHDAELSSRLEAMVAARTAAATADRGHIGAGARVAHVDQVIDVCIGPQARVVGAARLCNGTILSEDAAPATVGSGVVAQDFIFAEGASVEDGAVMHTGFVGQGAHLGKQFSAENSLFFANSEAFHGEACAVFAGPYTVTHHKSTLLIAGIYSFYNAGSGTNQSNHMYKLGPVHQGIIQRGTKNGSFSYMRWPSVVGPFCVIIGKHLNNFDLSDLPFSYVTEEGGESLCTPAMNMFTVGLARDGDKWPTRDRRTATVRRDQIHFDIYNPYTVGKMIRGETALNALYEETPRDVDQIRYKGVIIKRLLLRRSARNYTGGIEAYLRGKILARAAAARAAGDADVLGQALGAGDGLYSEDWTDVGGLLMGRTRLQNIQADIVSGALPSTAAVEEAFAGAALAYEADEWAWLHAVWQARHEQAIGELNLQELDELDAAHRKWEATFVKKLLADAEKEYDPVARYGYGVDGDVETQARDFEAVRGTFAGNSFVRQMQDRLAQ